MYKLNELLTKIQVGTYNIRTPRPRGVTLLSVHWNLKNRALQTQYIILYKYTCLRVYIYICMYTRAWEGLTLHSLWVIIIITPMSDKQRTICDMRSLLFFIFPVLFVFLVLGCSCWYPRHASLREFQRIRIKLFTTSLCAVITTLSGDTAVLSLYIYIYIISSSLQQNNRLNDPTRTTRFYNYRLSITVFCIFYIVARALVWSEFITHYTI